MHPRSPENTGFKRQVVFRIGADDWPLLQHAATEHGSIQAAVLAGLRALAQPADVAETATTETAPADHAKPKPTKQKAAAEDDISDVDFDPDEEIRAREAAQMLGLKTATISGYIRSRRLPGRYDDGPHGRGWLTTRGAVAAYDRTR